MNKKELLQVIEKAAKDEVTRLDLSGKELTELPAEIGQLVNLQRLNLSGNQLTTLPPEIAQLAQKIEANIADIADEVKEFLGLFLKDNPLSISPEILKDNQHPTKITNYYFQLQNSKPLNEAKMLIVGQGGVGKTSLVQESGSFHTTQKSKKSDFLKKSDFSMVWILLLSCTSQSLNQRYLQR